MNAVEQLLAHSERIVSLFDEMFSEAGSIPHDAQELASFECPCNGYGEPIGPPELAFLKSACPVPGLTDERADMASSWASRDALSNAVRLACGKGTKPARGLASRIVEVYCGWVAERQSLIDPNVLREIQASIVAESLLWGPHAATVAMLASSLAKAVERLREKPRRVLQTSSGRPFMLTGGPVTSREEWLSEKKQHLQPAIDAMHPYARPPKPAGSTSKKQTNDSRGRGGRRQNDEALARDLLDGWRAYKPEDGRKTKDRYLAQRPDVRTLKTPDARERKIASLRTALESAQHLSREKTKQKRRARG